MKGVDSVRLESYYSRNHKDIHFVTVDQFVQKHPSATVDQSVHTIIQQAKPLIESVLTALGHIILDKPEQIRLSLTCLLAGGHLLLQDLPGMGKTTLAESLARGLGLNYRRVQFTSDMLPTDIIGFSMFNPEKQAFEFRPGPIFTQVLLADEINRTSPKTQSALRVRFVFWGGLKCPCSAVFVHFAAEEGGEPHRHHQNERQHCDAHEAIVGRKQVGPQFHGLSPSITRAILGPAAGRRTDVHQACVAIERFIPTQETPCKPFGTAP